MTGISPIYMQSIIARSVGEYVTGQCRPLCVERAVRETLPAVTHTDKHTRIYTLQLASTPHWLWSNVCVFVWLNAKVLIEKRQREMAEDDAAHLFLPTHPLPFSLLRSSAYSPRSIIHTFPSSIYQNVHSIIIPIMMSYQIIYAPSKNYSSHSRFWLLSHPSERLENHFFWTRWCKADFPVQI